MLLERGGLSSLVLLFAIGSTTAVAATQPATSRVVVAGGGLTEILYALGVEDRIVGVDSTSMWPPAAHKKPQIGYLRALPAEGILSLSPTLVLTTTDGGPASTLKLIEAAGVPVKRLPAPRSAEDVRNNIRTLAALFNRQAEGQALIDELDSTLHAAQQQVATYPTHPRVLFVLGARGQLLAGGRQHRRRRNNPPRRRHQRRQLRRLQAADAGSGGHAGAAGHRHGRLRDEGNRRQGDAVRPAAAVADARRPKRAAGRHERRTAARFRPAPRPDRGGTCAAPAPADPATMSELAAAVVPRETRRLSRLGVLGVLFALLVAMAAAALFCGAAQLGPTQILHALSAGVHGNAAASDPALAIVTVIRLPRLLLAAAVGASLAVSGAAMQGLFRNPLADPSLIGVSSGAALGAVLVIVLGATLPWLSGPAALPLAASLGGLLATAVVYRLSRDATRTDVATLLLAGIAINAIAGAATGLLTYLADDQQLRSLTF
ncbi:MAG: iron chelate uptake ABC transporter family permease subunit, partial [Salinisphaera sp.]|nr:iron chelate uptake ABC transporter family permease subunit [Salinisphaera sp.]